LELAVINMTVMAVGLGTLVLACFLVLTLMVIG
jgi:hypothetical protein